MGRGFGFVEFKEHVHALECLRFLNNNPAFAWAAFRAKTLVELYERCGEKIKGDPRVLAKLVGEREEVNGRTWRIFWRCGCRGRRRRRRRD